MDSPGIEPGAFWMQIKRDTTTPQTHDVSLASVQIMHSVIGPDEKGMMEKVWEALRSGISF